MSGHMSRAEPFQLHQVEAELATVTAELVNVTSPASPASDEVAALRKSLTKVQKSLAAAQQKARLWPASKSPETLSYPWPCPNRFSRCNEVTGHLKLWSTHGLRSQPEPAYKADAVVTVRTRQGVGIRLRQASAVKNRV